MKFRIGSTFESSKFSDAPRLARKASYDTFQCFLGPAELVHCPAKSEATLLQFKADLLKNHVTMVIHGSYTINLCHPKQTTKGGRSIRALVSLLKQAEIIGKRCMGVIIHMGKNIKENKMTNEEALLTYAANLDHVIQSIPGKSKIVLETGAHQGTEVGSKLEHLGFIYQNLKPETQARIRFCIDTCHIWASGYDISTTVGVTNFFQAFDEKVGGKIVCIHFNNSMNKLDSHVDRHADLLHGEIAEEGLRAVALYAKQHHLALITETPLIHTTAEEELKTIRQMVQ